MNGSEEHNSLRSSAPQKSASDVLVALRALRYGGLDDATRALELGPAVAGSISAILPALRWGAVMIGLAWAAIGAASGDLSVVATLTITIFLASWRTVRPLRIGDHSNSQRALGISDVVILSGAIGISEGLTSPFVGSVLVAVSIVAFGWGLHDGMWAATAALAVIFVTSGIAEGGFVTPSALGVIALGGAAIFPGLAQQRLLQMEDRRQVQAETIGHLSDANKLLGVLNEVTRAMPSSLDFEEVLETTRDHLLSTFRADRIVLLTRDESIWAPQIQHKFDLPPTLPTESLPVPLFQASTAIGVSKVENLAAIAGRTGSGLYVRLVVEGVDTGLVAVERTSEPYSDSEAEIFGGMADVLALTISNSRQFRQLRSLAAAEERTRIARDLHDRLGQWLTYIGLELERINSEQAEPSMDLKQLHSDTQGAISELRDTLVELRASVSQNRPLSVLLGEVVDRFSKRSTIEVTLVVPDDRSIRLPPVTENELLRIAQEALTNVEKHAMASHAHVGWSVENGRGVLAIQDNGRGFDPAKGIRGTAYGLVGMRERAASVGAVLEITSEPDQGTVITVLTGITALPGNTALSGNTALANQNGSSGESSSQKKSKVTQRNSHKSRPISAKPMGAIAARSSHAAREATK